MNSDVVFEILNLAVSLAQAETTGKAQQDATLAGILLQIVARSTQAYHDHTGETLDPSLIKPEQVLCLRFYWTAENDSEGFLKAAEASVRVPAGPTSRSTRARVRPTKAILAPLGSRRAACATRVR